MTCIIFTPPATQTHGLVIQLVRIVDLGRAGS